MRESFSRYPRLKASSSSGDLLPFSQAVLVVDEVWGRAILGQGSGIRGPRPYKYKAQSVTSHEGGGFRVWGLGFRV